MLHSLAAVLAGFAVMTVVVMVGSFVCIALLPGGLERMRAARAGGGMPAPTPRLFAINIVVSLIAAVVGGRVTLALATRAPTGHLVALALVVLVMGMVSAFTAVSASQPRWYKLLIPAIGVLGVALAGVLFS